MDQAERAERRGCGFGRRAFLAGAGRLGLAALGGGLALDALRSFLGRADGADPDRPEALHYKRLPGKRIQCFLCPLDCILNDGETCFCRTRQNHGGKLFTYAYANPCMLQNDPVEKTPLNHYRPGERVLALGTGGCNLRCLYCQNWQQAQSRPEDLRTREVPPDVVPEKAKQYGIDTICLTYTEPVVFFEYAMELARHARRMKARTIVATAALVREKPLREMCKVTDAFCVALKAFNKKFYEKVCGIREEIGFQPVLDAMKVVKEEGVHLEVVTLIVPTLNDDPKEVAEMARWIERELGPNTPFHLARFVPSYRLENLPQTPIPVLEDARKAALDAGLRFVYLANVAPHDANDTSCPSCGKKLIVRKGFELLRNEMQNGRCSGCGAKVAGVWKG